MEPKREAGDDLFAMRLRVMTYNIRHGLGNRKSSDEPGRVDLTRIAAIVAAESPDIVAFQEVDRFWERSERVDQVLELASLLEMHPAFGPNLVIDAESNRRSAREYGVLTLSRIHPASQVHIRFPELESFEPRGFVDLQFTLPGFERFSIINTHLEVGRRDYPEESSRVRHEQVSVIVDRICGRRLPTIVMGDLNAEPGDRTIRTLTSERAGLIDAWQCVGTASNGMTIPASPDDEPSRRIDYILISETIRAIRCEVTVTPETRLASDHYPLVADLELPRAHHQP